MDRVANRDGALQPQLIQDVMLRYIELCHAATKGITFYGCLFLVVTFIEDSL